MAIAAAAVAIVVMYQVVTLIQHDPISTSIRHMSLLLNIIEHLIIVATETYATETIQALQ